MEIEAKLMGTLKEKAPDGGRLELPDGATIDDALRALDVSADSVQVFTVNGQLEQNRSRRLVAGDQLSIIPPVGGG